MIGGEQAVALHLTGTKGVHCEVAFQQPLLILEAEILLASSRYKNVIAYDSLQLLEPSQPPAATMTEKSSPVASESHDERYKVPLADVARRRSVALNIVENPLKVSFVVLLLPRLL